MINEILMEPGSFDVSFGANAPKSLLQTCDVFGHVVVVENWVEPGLFSDAQMLAMARYTGVVLERSTRGYPFTIRGAGLLWWLGDGSGSSFSQLETKVTLSASTLDNALDQFIPSGSPITKGSVTEPASGSYTGEFQFQTILSAIRTVCNTLGVEYRVNPDGTLDVGPQANLFVTSTPDMVVLREDYGSDPTYASMPVRSANTEVDGRNYATRVLLVESNPEGTGTLTASADLSPGTSYKDIHGNTMKRVWTSSQYSPDSTDAADYLSTVLSELVVAKRQDIEAASAEGLTGRVEVGDTFMVYDPPDMVDTSNPINFRGDVIWPVNVRFLEGSWTLSPHMGVYYRDKDAAYTDLSPYVAWESD